MQPPRRVTGAQKPGLIRVNDVIVTPLTLSGALYKGVIQKIDFCYLRPFYVQYE